MPFPDHTATCARPSETDMSQGWQIARELYGERADYGAAHHFACAVMQKRERAEWKARFAPVQIGEAA